MGWDCEEQIFDMEELEKGEDYEGIWWEADGEKHGLVRMIEVRR